nr:AraC family transcriptional regulator [uncultured Pseudomonas sp.]
MITYSGNPLTHSASLRRLLYEAMEQLGLDPAEVYRRIYHYRRLPPPILDERLAHEDAPLFWRGLVQITDDVDIGLHLGEAIKPRLLDVVGCLLLASRDLQQGLETFVRFQHLLSGGFAARLDILSDQAQLIFDLNYLGSPPLRQQMECLTLLLIKLLDSVCDGELRVTAVSFRHAAPPRTDEHRRLFGLLPRFGQAHDSLSLPLVLLKRPSRTANSGLYELLSRHATTQLHALDENQLLKQLHVLLQQRLAEQDCRLPDLARELGMASGALQRALAQQGLNLRGLREGLRQQRALQLLAEGGPIRDVARACGFAELSPFYRAFKRWYGSTPHQYRAHLQVASAAED